MFPKRRRSLRKKKKENPRKVLIRQIFIGFFLVVFFSGLGYGVWHGTRIEALTIKTVEISGGETISHEEVKRLAEEKLEGDYFRLVPKRFAWTFPENEISAVVSTMSRIRDVSVDRLDGNTISINFSEFHPYALWCDSLESSNCAFIDRDGYAFDAAPSLTGATFVRYLDPLREVKVDEQAFSSDYMAESDLLIDHLFTNFGFDVRAIIRTAFDEMEYHLTGGGYLKVSSRQSMTYTLENLESILGSGEFAHLEPGNFQYIDLRYGNKVFVNEEFNSKKETAATSTQAEGSDESSSEQQ